MRNPFLRAYEFEKKYGLDRLKLTLMKAEHAYSTYEPETIDFCKSALECICKGILRDRGYQGDVDRLTKLPTLIEKTIESLGISHGNGNIVSGIKNIVIGLGSWRTDQTIAGHGLCSTTPLPTYTDVQLFVRTFDHVIDIILTLHDQQEVDIQTTKMTFEVIEETLNLVKVNKNIDSSVNVEYSAEDGILFLEGKELKPSEVLFYFDRTTYTERVEKAKEERVVRLEEAFSNLIEEGLYVRFEDFHPGHYSVNELEISVYSMDITGTVAVVAGNIYASARLGASSDEEGIDVDYLSGFKARFKCLNIDDPDIFEL